jgi:hypothetical protein
MKIHLTMELYKECQGSYRYQGERDDVIHSLYIRKQALKKGERPPGLISITINPIG